jgi:hypothetical protein
MTKAAFFARNLAKGNAAAAVVHKNTADTLVAQEAQSQGAAVRGGRTWNWHTNTIEDVRDKLPHHAQLDLLRGAPARTPNYKPNRGASSSAAAPWSNAERKSHSDATRHRSMAPTRASLASLNASTLPLATNAPPASNALPVGNTLPATNALAVGSGVLVSRGPPVSNMPTSSAPPTSPLQRPSTPLARAQSATQLRSAQRRPQSATHLLPSTAYTIGSRPATPLSPWSGAAHFAAKTSSRPSTALAPAADGCRAFGKLTLRDSRTAGSSLAPSSTVWRIVRYVPCECEGEE